MNVSKINFYTPNYQVRQSSPRVSLNNASDTVHFGGGKNQERAMTKPTWTDAFLELMGCLIDEDEFEEMMAEGKTSTKDSEIKEAVWEADEVINEANEKIKRTTRLGKKLLRAGKRNNYKGYTQYGKEYKISYGKFDKNTGMPDAIVLRDSDNVYDVKRYYELLDGFSSYIVKDFTPESTTEKIVIKGKVIEYTKRDTEDGFTQSSTRTDDGFVYVEGISTEDGTVVDGHKLIDFSYEDEPCFYTEKNADGSMDTYIYDDEENAWTLKQ